MKKLMIIIHACLVMSLALGLSETANGAATPEITEPKPGSDLFFSQQQFRWKDNGTSVNGWQLIVGTSVGAYDIYDSGPLGADKKVVNMSGLPTDGSTVYVNLYYKIGSLWTWNEYTYSAANYTGIPIIFDPKGYSVISGESALFQFSGNGADVNEWVLTIGTSEGADDIYNSGSLFVSHKENDCYGAVTATGLPMDHSIVHVRLYYGIINGFPLFEDFKYLSAKSPAIITPTPGSTLTGRDLQTFTWTSNGNIVEAYSLRAGSSPGGSDIFDFSNMVATKSITLNGFPTDGRKVYVTLGYRINGVWDELQVEYKAINNPGFSFDFHSEDEGKDWHTVYFADWSVRYDVLRIEYEESDLLSSHSPEPPLVLSSYYLTQNGDGIFDNFKYAARLGATGRVRDYAGIIFRGDGWPLMNNLWNWNSGYSLVIDKDGYFQILVYIDGWPYPLKDWTPCAALNQGDAYNTLAVVADGPTMNFSINGTFVATVVDHLYNSGYAGVLGLMMGDHVSISVDWADLTPF